FFHGAFDSSGVDEWTVEANPGLFPVDLARLLRAGGVTRISLGAQSFDDARLSALGRIHSAAEARAAAETAHRCGFPHLSLDLMYGLPETGVAEALEDAARAIELGPDHLSCYALEPEDGTPFRERGVEVDGGAQRDAYEALRPALAAAGSGPY
ncbi:MAG: radical SAM protein, partial [Kiritimatiellae bacterium]|nr:radical SAM protein [Kiritimatiellia bacterium]